MTRSLILILTCVMLTVAGQVLLKSGMNQIGRIGAGDIMYYKQIFLRVALNPYVLLGLSLYVLSAFIWLVILSRVDLSFAYPFAALGYVGVVFVSYILLQEPVTASRWIGAIFVCLGLVFISRS